MSPAAPAEGTGLPNHRSGTADSTSTKSLSTIPSKTSTAASMANLFDATESLMQYWHLVVFVLQRPSRVFLAQTQVITSGRVLGQKNKVKSKENITPKRNASGSREANLINAETAASLREEINYLWEIYRIDKMYREAFMESMAGLPPKMHIQVLAKEIENLYNEKAAIQQIFVAIQQREECIGLLEEAINGLQENSSVAEIKEQVSFAMTPFLDSPSAGEAKNDIPNGSGEHNALPRPVELHQGHFRRRQVYQLSSHLLPRLKLPAKNEGRHSILIAVGTCKALQLFQTRGPVFGDSFGAVRGVEGRFEVGLELVVGGGRLTR